MSSDPSLQAGQPRRFFDPAFRHTVRNSSWSIATTAVTASAFFVETILLARYLGPETFGVYLLVVAYPGAIQLFFDFRTREAMTRYLGSFLARREGDRAVAVVKLLWLVDLAVACGTYVLVFVTAPVIAPHLTDDPDTAHLMRVFGLALLLGGMDATAGTIVRVFDRFRLSFIAGSGAMIFRLSIIVALVLDESSLEGIIWGRVAAEAGVTVIMGTVALLLLRGALWEQRGAPIRRLSGQFGDIARFLTHTNIQGSVRAAAAKLDVIAVGAIAGPSTASFYKVGVQFGSAPLLLSDPLFSSVYPQFARSHALGEDGAIRRIGSKTSIVLASVTVPVALGLALASERIITLALGDAFSDAALPFVIALTGVVPVVIFFWGRAAMLAVGDARVATRITLASTVLQFVVLLALVQTYGAAGAAVGFATMSLSTVLLTVRYLRRRSLL